MKSINIDGNNLTLEEIKRVAVGNQGIRLSEAAKKAVRKCRDYVEKLIADKRIVYGLTTGFGKFAGVTISPDKIEELQENLILSHATGVGEHFSIPETRAITLLRCNVLAKGFSGVRISTLETLIKMLNAGIHPCIPEKGSVGASGDLAPLSHLALVLIGEGYAEYKGEIIHGKEALQKAGLKPVRLAAKEGLALNNGTQVMTAVGALTLLKAQHLCKVADVCAAVSVDTMLGTPAAFHELIHSVRPHQGQIRVAENLNNLLLGSKIRKSHLYCDRVQDPYSLRCVPQVHGAVRDALEYVRNTIEIEINSATDNPLIFPDQGEVISGGNFHGEPVAFACDVMGLTMAELGSISERRIEQICNPALNRDLKPFLAPRPGLDSGFMIAHVTAAALVSENKTLAHPASVDSIPTSANQEDHVSMGTIGSIKARSIVDNIAHVLGIELMIALQGLEERKIKSSPVIEAIRKEVRKDVAFLKKDRNLNDDIHFMKRFVESEKILEIIREYLDIK
ncbi:MAG: histidine ammonia-lyase [Candidatus Cloacimonetes bacterium]|nr:histidine ammonia-lyase [Candidatus Cloacimonadota bacterium]